jgi:hypothetical protein
MASGVFNMAVPEETKEKTAGAIRRNQIKRGVEKQGTPKSTPV